MAEQIQLGLAIATLPFAIAFTILFAKPSERWWRTTLGWSLMVLCWAVIAWTCSVILYRINGGPYLGRDYLIVGSSVLTFAAMVSRTWVLWSAQRHERRLRHRGVFDRS